MILCGVQANHTPAAAVKPKPLPPVGLILSKAFLTAAFLCFHNNVLQNFNKKEDRRSLTHPWIHY